MFIKRNDFDLNTHPSSAKNITAQADYNASTLKINLMNTPIELALKAFKDYDKVAIITRHSIRGEDYSAAGDLIEIGEMAAQKLGQRIRAAIGPHEITYFSTNVARCKSTCRFINRGLNETDEISINLEKEDLIHGDYFDYSGANGWEEIANLIKSSATISQKVNEWKNLFIQQEIPSGISWWVSHDSFVMPLIYHLTEFSPEDYSRANNFEGLPWSSPLTGIIIAIKGEHVIINTVTGLETGFVDSANGQYDYYDDVFTGRTGFKKQVATTKTHPDAVFLKAVPDENYIFDDTNNPGHPLYCTGTFEGCIGSCVNCQTCDSCQTQCFDACVSCNECQSCVSCQATCQTSGYGYPGNVSPRGYTVPLERVKYVRLCSGNLTNSYYRKQITYVYKCDNSCMTCVAENYACSDCYTGEYLKK